MHIPKKYGQSKTDNCPFCGKLATYMNSQGVPVCISHKEETLDDLKCVCGSSLDMLKGKFGVFFSCQKCGNMNLNKVLEFNTIKTKSVKNKETKQDKTIDYKGKKIITIRSDDPRYFD